MSETNNESGGISNEIKLAWKLLRDPESPIYLMALPILAGLYFIVPEWFVGGPLLVTPIDDVAVLYAALKGIKALAPPHLVAKYTGDTSLNYVDGEYEVIESDDNSAENSNDSKPDVHKWD